MRFFYFYSLRKTSFIPTADGAQQTVISSLLSNFNGFA